MRSGEPPRLPLRPYARVRSIRVELHPDKGFYASDCIARLERLGFQTRRFETFRTTHVFGLRA